LKHTSIKSLAVISILISLFLLPLSLSAQEGSGGGTGEGTGMEEQVSTLTLNEQIVHVRWTDGDSFDFIDGPYQGQGVRLEGYNSLEHYGPVHRWGDWSPQELYVISEQATELARQGSWTCVTDGSQDHYGRVLVNCEDLTLSMLSSGLGHLYAFDSAAPDVHVRAQAEAQSASLGMWAKGVPEFILTSLHSADEGGDSIYNRIVSTADGHTEQVTHQDTYTLCQEVCVRDSCLVYVPFNQRYGDSRAECLR
jgi:micrococcal nuclease